MTMRRFTSAILVLGILCELSCSGWASQTDLAKVDWSSSSPASLAANPVPADSVLGLIEKLEGLNDLRLCSARFADLRGSDNLSLVVSTEQGRFCNVQIVDKTASGFELYDVDSSRDSRIAIEDLAESGTRQLIVDVDLTSYEGANHCEATWPAIYAWIGNGYGDVSSRYKDFYRRKLAALNHQIAALPMLAQRRATAVSAAPAVQNSAVRDLKVGGWGPPQSADSTNPETVPSASARSNVVVDARNADCLRAEAAKIERSLGLDKEAGLNDAIQWANSDDPWTREFASDILLDIGTSQAAAYLRTLSGDPSGRVATSARENLTSIGQPSAKAVERLPVDGK
jgi:hypothetical protein